MIKAIETRYKGYRFRSRLEARWAVFLDALGIRWEYEPEGFDLGDAGWYLPDFYLPTFCGGMYCEVKPIGGDYTKARSFVEQSGQMLWLCEGTPSMRIYFVLMFYENKVIETNGIPNADQAEGCDRMFWCPGYEERDGSLSEKTRDYLGDTFPDAVAVARSARFEHGESPL
jgi:hypothetical protein